jgi:hypothetical protein
VNFNCLAVPPDPGPSDPDSPPLHPSPGASERSRVDRSGPLIAWVRPSTPAGGGFPHVVDLDRRSRFGVSCVCWTNRQLRGVDGGGGDVATRNISRASASTRVAGAISGAIRCALVAVLP